VSFVVTDARTGRAVLPAGIDAIDTVAVTVSPVPVERYVCESVTDAAAPGTAEAVRVEAVNVSACGTAVEGTTESIPKPNAATATSATRLKVVFVDICFLSISRFSDDPSTGCG
jgi:hypothetical protein